MIYLIGLKVNGIETISKERALHKISQYKLICEDTETKTLDYHEKNPIKLVQIGTEEDQFVFSPEEAKSLKPILEDRNITKIVVNGVFERNMLRSLSMQLNSMFDLSLAYKVYRQGKEVRYVKTKYGEFFIYSLGGMMKELLSIDINKAEQTSFLQDTSTYTQDQIRYAADDVKLFNLYQVILNKLIKKELITEDYRFDNTEILVKEDKFRKAILEFKYQEYLADMLYNGIYIDSADWLKLEELNKIESYKRQEALNELIIKSSPKYKNNRKAPISYIKEKTIDLFTGEEIKIDNKVHDKRRVNWKSSQQVKEVFRELKIAIPNVKGKDTLDIKELKKVANAHPLLPDYIKYKELSKLIDSYGSKMLTNINKNTGRIHFQVDQLLATGRLAPYNPNMAQIPSSKEWRNCFKAQRGVIVGADYSAQESRVMAYKSKDDVFIDFFENGDGDSHSMVASKVYSTKERLEITITKLSMEVKFPEKDESIVRKLLKELYPNAKQVIKEEGKLTAYGKLDMSNKDEKGEECPLRQKGKILNFFISFGGSSFTLSQSQNISMEEANDLLNGFWGAFKKLKLYFDAEKGFALANGYNIINHITKGRRSYPEHKEMKILQNKASALIKEKGFEYYKKLKMVKGTEENRNASRINIIKGEIERAAMNTGIQGTAADMTKTSAILYMETLEKDGYNLITVMRPTNMIHDEHSNESDDEYKEYSSKVMKKSMEDASIIFIGVIIPAAPYISTKWEH